MESALRGESTQPSDGELQRMGARIAGGEDWANIFSGAASISIATDGSGLNLSLRITKNDGMPITIVNDGSPGTSAIALKRVNELGFYSMGPQTLADKIGISVPMLNALVEHLGIKNDIDCYKEFTPRKTPYKQYSQNAMKRIRECIETEDVDAIWEADKERRRQARQARKVRPVRPVRRLG